MAHTPRYPRNHEPVTVLPVDLYWLWQCFDALSAFPTEISELLPVNDPDEPTPGSDAREDYEHPVWLAAKTVANLLRTRERQPRTRKGN